MHLPNISFVIIVLNGMPFIECCLNALYEEAHQIIVVEGAVEKCLFAANADGSSNDGTVECIRNFPDPQNKITLLQGIWPEKCEMQNEALKHVTGDYVWLVDSDEIYKQKDLRKLRLVLAGNPGITQVNVIPDNFWKGYDYLMTSRRYFQDDCHFRRVFKYVPGAHFSSHRPPTMYWPGHGFPTECMSLLDGHTTRRMGIFPYHYSYVQDSQVEQKMELYRRYGWESSWTINVHDWYEQCFLPWTPENRALLEKHYPIWIADPKSTTRIFRGEHPDVMHGLIAQQWRQAQ